jgi:hypothetical protein
MLKTSLVPDPGAGVGKRSSVKMVPFYISMQQEVKLIVSVCTYIWIGRVVCPQYAGFYGLIATTNPLTDERLAVPTGLLRDLSSVGHVGRSRRLAAPASCSSASSIAVFFLGAADIGGTERREFILPLSAVGLTDSVAGATNA